MLFGREEKNGDYIVQVFIDLGDGCSRWHPLRNFGERQGDSIAFKEYDCPRLNLEQIRALIHNYKADVKYERINGRRFIKQTGYDNRTC